MIAASRDGQIAALGSQVDDALAAELQEAVAGAPPSRDLATPPVSFARCEQLLKGSLGTVELSAGPSYVIPPKTAFQSAAEVQRSDGDNNEAFRSRIPKQANWSTDEWDELFDGLLGPWAMATIAGQVIAICHSARLADRGAEAGVWTDPEFRGQGHAAAVTAAWASMFADSPRHLFYSTSAENRSSQRVAARLNLRPIGWMWKLSSPRPA